MVDALSHLPLFANADEARAHVQQAAREGVTEVICAGTDPRLPELATSLSANGARVHRAFGIHPRHASDEALPAQLQALRERLRGAIALGECGLDHRKGQAAVAVQERTWRAQLDLARQLRLPVILHLIGAWSRAMDILESEGPLPGGGIWHAFAGPKEAIARAEAMGLGFSIGGLVHNPHARRLHEALLHIPPHLLVVETDMPHQPAVSLAAVVRALAGRLGEEQTEVARRTQANAARIFRIPG